MISENNKDYYCSAELFDGQNKIEVCDPGTGIITMGVCIDICRKCHNYHRKWPTPEQFREEYGEEYPNDGAVYVLDDTGRTMRWIIYLGVPKLVYMDFEFVVCACTPWGCPPEDWRPE